MTGLLTNEVEVEGGLTANTPKGSGTQKTKIGSVPQFEVSGFDFEPLHEDGSKSTSPGGHPDMLLTSIEFPSLLSPQPESAGRVIPVEVVKDLAVELPAGFLGDPLATERCPQRGESAEVGTSEELCQSAHLKSKLGVIEFNGDGVPGTSDEPNSGNLTTPVFNIQPEVGYPDEMSFSYQGNGVNVYAGLVHNSSGYRLRVSVPGIPAPDVLGLVGVEMALYGNPGKRDGASAPYTAFLTNPADCSEGPLKAKVEANSWEHPEHWVSRETTVYPQLENCNLLQFEPKFEMAPSPAGAEEGTSQADEPSAYNVDLKVPQKELFEETATPQLKGATVTLPEGVSVSPSAADGLAGCKEHGPEGIDIPSGNHVPNEAGEGEEIGPDGLSHLIAGHCPRASTLGTVEITTPLLEKPLRGHVFLAQPKCGGEGQPACTEASATNGELYGLYVEAEGSGVVIKIPGSVSADPTTGRLQAKFTENPQLPFSELKLHFHGGPRAPLANPQTCGSFATTTTLSSWAGQEIPGTSPAFSVDWDGNHGACPASLPFAPGFSAGTTNPAGGAFSPFVLSFSRNDREQNLSGLSVTLPPGLLAKIAGIPLCGEGPANAGTCGPESQVGTASVLAGPGTHPLSVSGGRVYLTVGYKGQPFGLSIVVPAVAGPFNLGDVVVRASIHIDPSTAQTTVTSDPLPQSRDGVPFRLRTVITEIDRPGFTFNPTNCAQQSIAATISGAAVKAGEAPVSASVSSPFAATGCAGLPFKPSFSASTSGKTSKANGASFDVKVSEKPGEANIHKVDLQLPLALPARLTTLQKACTDAQFKANPAGCPEASNIGTAIATTPVLNDPLTGPAYLVSHGGAAFPDVEFVLQGDGVTIVLDGGTDIKKGITYSKFETVPDAPITSFETVLPEGPHSALAANGDLCSQSLLAPTTIVAQNGAQVTQSTKIAVTGCAKLSVKIGKTKLKGNALLVTVTTTQQGTVTIMGNGLKTLKKSLGAGTHKLKVSLTKRGSAARGRHRKIRVKASVKNSGGSSSRTLTVKL